jgi:hypothetical protein
MASRIDAKELCRLIKVGNGIASLKTISGNTLIAMLNGKKMKYLNKNESTSNSSIYNVYQSNEVIHIFEAVVTLKG